MRRVIMHRRASRYLRRMPPQRQAQMVEVIEQVAGLEDISTHPGIRQLKGVDGWFRLRVGIYRAVLQPREDGSVEVLFVDYIGPRGDAYKD